MSIRTILYGYTVQNGKKTILLEQAEIVNEVFERYLAGESLKQIADSLTLRKVIYNGGSFLWNKNIISRMIADERYNGNEEYPMLISHNLFKQVAEMREKKSAKKAEISPINKLIKSKLVCERCGHTLSRINKWYYKEKWLCTCGCEFDVYIDDNFLLEGIRESMSEAAEKEVSEDIFGSSCEPSMEITRMTNEIYRLMELPKVEFKAVANAILDCASERFDCCRANGNREQLQAVQRAILNMGDTLDETVIEKTVAKIFIDQNGNISLVLKGEANIRKEAINI